MSIRIINACGVALCVTLATVPWLTAAGYAADTSQATTTKDSSPNGSLEKYHGDLRGSELTGANVYDDQGNSIAKVSDLLVGDGGKIQNVVLSVGGVLGVGTHYVSVPFDKLQVQPSRADSGMMATSNTMAGSGSSPSNASAGAGATPAPASPTVGADVTKTANPTKYFSLVMPGETKDSLGKMAEFNYNS